MDEDLKDVVDVKLYKLIAYLEILREIMRDYQDQDFGRKMPWEDV